MKTVTISRRSKNIGIAMVPSRVVQKWSSDYTRSYPVFESSHADEPEFVGTVREVRDYEQSRSAAQAASAGTFTYFVGGRRIVNIENYPERDHHVFESYVEDIYDLLDTHDEHDQSYRHRYRRGDYVIDELTVEVEGPSSR